MGQGRGCQHSSLESWINQQESKIHNLLCKVIQVLEIGSAKFRFQVLLLPGVVGAEYVVEVVNNAVDVCGAVFG